MWIEELDIRGFKRLRGIYRFSRGLTIVAGDNEAGKSTLHEALLRALFGFARAEQRRAKGGASHKDRCRPWAGDAFGINALLHEAGGRSLRAEWDFVEQRLRLRDADTGEDLTGGIAVVRNEVRLGRALLAMGLPEFRDVCCLDQITLQAVRRTQDLVLALQRVVETGAPDLGIEDAVRVLNEFLRVDVGIHSGHFHELPGGPLAVLRRERNRLAEALARCEAGRAEVKELSAELTERAFELEVLGRSVLELEQRLLLAEQVELEDRLEQAGRLERRARDVPAHPVRPPEGAVSKVRQRLADVERLEARAGRLTEEVAAGEARLRELESRRAELTARFDALAAHAGTDRRAEASVLELRGRRDALCSPPITAPGPSASAPDPLLARYRVERPRLAEIERRWESLGWSGRRLVGAAIAVAASAAIAALGAGGPAGTVALTSALLIAAGVLVYLARPAVARAPLARRRAEALAPFGADSLAELDERVAAEDRRLAVAQATEEARVAQESAARAQIAEVEAEIARLLDQVRAPALLELDERVKAYLTACRRAAERLELEAELERVRAELQRARRPLDELREIRGELMEQRSRLAEAYGALGIEAADPARALGALGTLLARAEEDARQLTAAGEAATALRLLLGGETLGELAERAAEAARRVEDHAARHGRLAARGADRAALESERQRLHEEARQADIAVAQLRTRLELRERELPDPAELKERLAEAESRIAVLERAMRAVRLAREELEQAAQEAHRRFAPRLNAALRRHLPTITGGRYREAAVDEDLCVQVRAPETGRLVPVSALSRGTQDQIYLLQRLEIVRMLDRSPGEIPLLLDDPFVHFDRWRLRRALEVLREVAAERQVFLFTEDRDLVREARAACPECATIELAAPESGVEVTGVGSGALPVRAAAEAAGSR